MLKIVEQVFDSPFHFLPHRGYNTSEFVERGEFGGVLGCDERNEGNIICYGLDEISVVISFERISAGSQGASVSLSNAVYERLQARDENISVTSSVRVDFFQLLVGLLEVVHVGDGEIVVVDNSSYPILLPKVVGLDDIVHFIFKLLKILLGNVALPARVRDLCV